MSLQIDLLQQSFEPLRAQADQFGAAFYETLFADYPDAVPLFANTSIINQQGHLMKAIAYTIDNLQNTDALIETLQKLGARHVSYGAIKEHYPLVGATLLKTLKNFSGDTWTPTLEQAWTDAYEAIAQIMLQGAETAVTKTA